MIEVPDQEIFNPVLTDAGFITVNMPCLFAFSATPSDIDIHFTTNAQIWGVDGQTLHIKNPNLNPNNASVAKLSYAKANL